MILTAHQPTYLPWLGLFHKIALSDAFVFFDHVQYSKKQYYNRNTITTQHGPLTLSVQSRPQPRIRVRDGAGDAVSWRDPPGRITTGTWLKLWAVMYKLED